MHIFLFFLAFLSMSFAAEVPCPPKGKEKALFRPVFENDTYDQQKLLVCGQIEGEGEKALYSDFEVISHNGKKYSSVLMKTEGNESYWAKKTPNSIVLEELKFVKGEYMPFYKHEISCNKKECLKHAKLCIFKKIPKFQSGALEEIRTYVKGENEKRLPPDFLITELRDLALTGNQKAFEIFQKNPGFKLSGETKDEFEASKEILVRLKKSNCL